jgi:hypothetical protein
MRYQFTVLTKKLTKITGTLEVDSPEIAKDILHEMEMSVMDISKSPTERKPVSDKEGNQFESYVFEGQTFKSNAVSGTIDALNRENAYKRLVQDCKVEVKELYKEGLSEAEITALKTKGLTDLESKISQNNQDLNKKETKEEINKAEQEKQKKVLEEQSQEIQKEVNEVVVQTKKILQEYGDRLPPSSVDEIKVALDKLLVMKMSSNFSRIRQLMNELLALLKPKDKKNELFGIYDKAFLIKEEQAEEKEDLTAYNEAIKRGNLRSGIKGMGQSFKDIFKNQKQKGHKKMALKRLWLRLSTIDSDLYTLKSAQIDLLNEMEVAQSDLELQSDELKKRELQQKITDYTDQLSELGQLIADQEASIKTSSRMFLKNLRFSVGCVMFFYGAFFVLLHYGMQFGLPFFADLVESGVSVTYVATLSLMGILCDIFLRIKTRYFPSSVWSNVSFGFVGVCFVMVVISNF